MQYLDKEYGLNTQYDPLPRFGIYTMRTGTTPGYGFNVFNSNMNVIASQALDLNGEAATNNGNTAIQTDAQPGSVATTNMVQGTNANGVLGNTIVRLPMIGNPFNAGSFYGAHFTSIEGATSNGPQGQVISYGTSIGEYGVRSRTAMFLSNTIIGLYGRTNLVPLDRFTLTNGTHLNTTGEPGTVSYGMISYNDRTRTLIILRAANVGTSYRVHVWKNPNMSLNNRHSHRTGQMYKFITDAYGSIGGASYYYNDFTWSGGSTVEACNHMRVVLGDNDRVGLFRMNQNTASTFAYVQLNPASTSGTLTTLSTLTGNNPSYGIDNGNRFGTQSQISWDNQWMATYCSYSSYHSGINLVLFYIPNPALYYTYQSTDASGGINLAPLGVNRWVFTKGLNADTFGPKVFTLDPECSRVHGRQAAGGAVVANGGILTETDPTMYVPDSWSTTTNWYALVPVECRDTSFMSTLGV